MYAKDHLLSSLLSVCSIIIHVALNRMHEILTLPCTYSISDSFASLSGECNFLWNTNSMKACTSTLIIIVHLLTLFAALQRSLFALILVRSNLQQWNLICSRNDTRVVSDNGVYTYNNDRASRSMRLSLSISTCVRLTHARRLLSCILYNAPIILERPWEGRNNSVITSGISPEEPRAR